MKRVRDIREQLVGLMDRVEITMESCGDDDVSLRKAITSGYFANVAQLFKPSEGCYKTVKARHSVYIHPGSGALSFSDVGVDRQA
jgi:pre-mRNA-splicing factor ATP-dependent RNA helicase DHX16